ncbi:DUF5683 domain-containing protein [Aquimarina algicola]|uniref:DUF5683 domain-containing protein n=1 Tax=Aquimarina algicola TaxID=2589995 RepID=UPI001CF5E3A0|nr:DUF5683 domain-containing protein [Aquimarina algicola]
MKIKSFYIIFFVLFSVQHAFCQEAEEIEESEELKVTTEEVEVKKKKKKRRKKREKKEREVVPYEPLAPARAAFYSAILPGLGQAYTKKYWKIPIVYAAIGTGIYSYVWNNDQLNRFRDAYKRRLAGINDPEFDQIATETLLSLQDRYRRDQELSILITVGLYLLNIVDANVTAHLQQYNITDDLSFKPKININEFDASPNYGFSINYSF